VRILLISDIHANLEAMLACLEVLPPYDLVANLGDIVGYGASPNEVTDRSRELGGLLVRGNHDKVCSGVEGVEDFNPVAGLAALWTRETLTPENLAWLKELPQGPIPVTGLEAAQLVHGSPLDEDEYVITIRDALEPLETAAVPVTFFGHTHIQGGFFVEEDDWVTLRPDYADKKKTESCEITLKPGARYMINPGSVGQPRDADPRAAFAWFDSDESRLVFYRVPYDVPGAQRRIREAGLPERLAARLTEGR
jgi:diadenosine tetraphosphatase ApaH/serine/threonine PP2A family protein phosphatase